jgi:hypothetical protein
MGYRVTAVEASAEMCRVLKAKAAAGVEGAVAAPCVVCQQSSVPTEQRHPVEVVVANQSICEPLPDNGFDLGLCVFTVLNYIVEKADIRHFASVAANAVHPGGKLLVSFIAKMAPMMGHFNDRPKSGKSPDGRCSAVRNISINPLQETLYEYAETSKLTRDGEPHLYPDKFRLREWSREQIVAAIEAAGFRDEQDLTPTFASSGEIYLLFSRDSPAENPPASVPARVGEDPKAFFKRMAVRNATEPDDSRSILPETPENVRLLTLTVESRRDHKERTKVRVMLENIHKRRVFFYPGASVDWEPLHRFTHQCDTFIFCDWQTKPDVVVDKFAMPWLKTQMVLPLDEDTVKHLAEASRLHPRIWRIVKRDGPPPVAPWGKYARLVRKVGNEERTIHFFYLGMEGVTVFYNLFLPLRAAPQTICYKAMRGFSGNWTDFYNWDRPLGQLVRCCNTQPTFLVADYGKPDSWPYPRLWQRFPNWDGQPATYVKEDFQATAVHASSVGGPRRVIVRRGLLTPEAVADCEALVLPTSLYLEHYAQWPVDAQILLLAPPDQEGQLPKHPAAVHFASKRHAPLGHILKNVTEKCAELGIHRVSSVGIGYEDEGPELDEWRRQAGMPLELTIHCEHEGDVVSFGPYADEIQ